MSTKDSSFTALTLMVKKGSGRGKLLGFPTLNFHIDQTVKLEPGIYRCFLSFARGRGLLGALCYGSREMFGEKEKSLEVHLLEGASELPANILGKSCTIEVREKIRDVERFTSEEELKVAIAKDLETIKRLTDPRE